MSKLEDDLAWAMRVVGLPEPVREFRFAPPRRWLADFAWPDLHIIVEVQGGVFSGGRHIRPVGYERDLEKANAAQSLGWRYFSFTQRQIKAGEAINVVEAAIRSAEAANRPDQAQNAPAGTSE